MPSRIRGYIVKELTDSYRSARNMIVVGYRGLTVANTDDLRREFGAGGVHMRVIRNRLCNIAFKQLGNDKVSAFFDGPTAIIDGEDPVTMARIAVEFARRNAKLEIKGGVVEGSLLDAGGIRDLARMPNRKDLLAQISGQIGGPASALVAALIGPARALAGCIKKRAEDLEKQGVGLPEDGAAAMVSAKP